MSSISSQAMPILQTLWRHKWLAIGVAWLVCIGGWIAIAFVPTKYESSARVYLNADPLLTPLLKGLAADTNPTRHLDFMQRTLLSRPNLEQMIRLTDLDIGANTPEKKEALLKHLAAEVIVKPVTANLLSISYQSGDPVLAKNMVQSLLTIFAEQTAGSSRAEMDSAQRFLDDQIASYREQLRAAEKRRAQLVQQYPDIVPIKAPDSQGTTDSGNRLEQARRSVAQLKGELEEVTAKRDSLKKELASVPPTVAIDQAPQVVVTGERRLSPDEVRLQDLRKNLDGLRLKYTDEHPDVVATRQAIKQVESEMKRGGGGQSGGAGTNKGQIPNTVYDQLKVKLVDAEGLVATVQRRLSQGEADLERAEKVAKSAPGVFAQVQDLDRDYSVLRKNYEELVARRESAQIANAADTKTEKIQFRIVDPPQVPLRPVVPNRPLLISVVLLAGFGAGLVAPFAMKQLDRSFATIGQLRNLGVPILGSVSRLTLGPARRRAAVELLAVGASALVLLAVYGTLLALNIGFSPEGVS